MPRGLADGFTPGVGKFILRFTLILVWGYTKVMIRSIRGKIIARTPPKIVVEASGLGYGVNVPLSALETLSDDQEIFLYIYHHLSEDRSDLYGFLKHCHSADFRCSLILTMCSQFKIILIIKNL